MALTEFGHGITAVDTGFGRPNFDASHLIEQGDECAFVDTGTNFSVPNLLAALDARGLAPRQVRYLLLTHVHLDHAGGAGELMQCLPQATAVLHPRGARHMVDPHRLVAGSIAVYGETAFRQTYGNIVPIDADRIATVEDDDTLSLGGRTLRFLHTEGHARHHYCIYDEASRSVFSGDTFGVSYREFDTDKGAFISPAATPTEFDPDAMHASIDRLMSLEPEAMYLTHYSRVTDLNRLAADLHGDIDAFVSMVTDLQAAPHRRLALRERMEAHYGARLRSHGVDMPERNWLELFAVDLNLNVQGVEVWFDRMQRQRETCEA